MPVKRSLKLDVLLQENSPQACRSRGQLVASYSPTTGTREISPSSSPQTHGGWELGRCPWHGFDGPARAGKSHWCFPDVPGLEKRGPKSQRTDDKSKKTGTAKTENTRAFHGRFWTSQQLRIPQIYYDLRHWEKHSLPRAAPTAARPDLKGPKKRSSVRLADKDPFGRLPEPGRCTGRACFLHLI
ncbi:centromere protein R isoform X1 [Monodelphis domestica]|uniref:centromere protein R isoform X1 n=1 Tax=Monodelphis domestica TaxID=13616 RepID=UPI0007B3FF84|nr:centromere protein R isoform X1 [Monodelphis domestica]